MNKEQQIIEWFEDNEFDIFSEVALRLPASKQTIFVDYKYLAMNVKKLQSNYINFQFPYVLVLKCIRNISYHFKMSVKDVVFNLKETLIKKDRDYGNSFDKSINKFGWIYLAIELDKKKNRLHSLLKSKEKPNYESIEDTLLDIAGYCVLALIYIDNNKE